MRHRLWIAAIRLASLAGAGLLASCGPAAVKAPAAAPDVDWPYYGADAGGQRFSPAAQVTPANVRSLKIAWRYATGDVSPGGTQDFAFEDTPILAGGRLYVCSPFDEVAALDPATGRQLWRFDPKVDRSVEYPNSYTCRGVAYWRDPAAPPGRPAPRGFS